MNRKLFFILLVGIIICQCKTKHGINVLKYHSLINEAEKSICRKDYKAASQFYTTAFTLINKPFGKDAFNAVLSNYKDSQKEELINNIQILINNSEDLEYLKTIFVGEIISITDWEKIISKRTVEFNTELRKEMKIIHERDQLFRPMYEVYNDTIEANRVININRIIEITKKNAFPSHQELGYTKSMTNQDHYIVLHHTAQRRSQNKSITDLENLFEGAVLAGRFDPEIAIFYMSLQNDENKGRFETYSTWQYKHPLIPDSLNNKIWLPNLTDEQIKEINDIRKSWYANSLHDIALKANYLHNNPNERFIFTSVHKSIGNLSLDFDLNTALEQYKMFTSQMTVVR